MLIHWIWLATRPGMNDRQKLAALEAFGDAEDVYFADRQDCAGVEGISQASAEALADKNLTPAEEILEQCRQKGIRICTLQDAAYPARLKNIADPPVVLYYKGQIPDLDRSPVIAVVGTRKASAYGMTVAKRMGYQIARCGGIVVSGLASGIDGVAMRGALTAGNAVVGVLGCGADVVYPLSNRSLYADTENCGCLLTEFPPGTQPLKWNFPKRNRIISGLSSGVLVVEAPERSGALITARQAADQGRDVFVVPGNIDVDTCAGSNALLREGAISVSSGWDVVSEYAHLYPEKIRKDTAPSRQSVSREELENAWNEREKASPRVAQKPRQGDLLRSSDRKKEKKPIDNGENRGYSDQRKSLPPLTEEENRIMELLQGELLVDDLLAQLGLPTGKVLSALTMLQIKGLIRQLPGKRVARSE
ncbi:MAG: DNA-protecting protein DprA [Ruminococcaceae bacterium]|nr:DNA-protecting protein DprA [Oscillospiraceae bacterium]